MAEETPENIVEEVETAAETGRARRRRGASRRRAGRPRPPRPRPAASKLEARREARRPQPRGQVTPEQREEERQARRAATAKQRRAYRAKLKERRAAEGASRGPGPDRVDRRSTAPAGPKVRQGVVTSAKGDKTITVKIDVVQRHRRYHKIMRSTTKLYAHDEANTAGEGDTVRVVECRPMSRSKRWRLTDVLERAK